MKEFSTHHIFLQNHQQQEKTGHIQGSLKRYKEILGHWNFPVVKYFNKLEERGSKKQSGFIEEIEKRNPRTLESD